MVVGISVRRTLMTFLLVQTGHSQLDMPARRK
jgi:hypothetical protein